MRNFSIGSSRGIAAIAVLVLAAISSTALAADATWNGTGGNALWATPGNWSAAVPGTGNIATFNNAGDGNTVIDLGVSGVTVKTVFFDTAGAAAYTIGSGAVGSQTLTLDNAGAVTMNPAVGNNQLFNANVLLGTATANTAYIFTNNSQTNTLTFAGNIQGGTGGTAGAKTLTVAGWGGNTSISGIIGNGGSSALALTKSGAGTLTLSGLNTYTGPTSVSDGTLLLDMTGTGSLSSSSNLFLGGGATNSAYTSGATFGGTFSVLGKTSGATALSMGTLRLANKTSNRIVLNPNGGDGTTLTLASIADRSTGASLLFDYSVNPGTQAVVVTDVTNYPLKNGIFKQYLVKDSAGVTGFATRDLTNKIIRYDDTTGDTLTANSSGANKNFSTLNSTYSAGTLSWTGVADRYVSSLTIDTTISGGIIDMGAATNALRPTANDEQLPILFKGSNDATLTGGRIGPSANEINGIFIHQTGTGTLTINSPIQTGWSTDLTKDGEGTLVLGGTFVSDTAGPGTGAVVINGGTVKPGVASVPGVTGPFGRNPVILADVAGATLDLDTYNTSIGSLGGGGLLGGNVKLNAQSLTVGDNNASATYAGVISSTGSPTTSLIKVGTGTQTLTGASTYTGATSVNRGTLTLNGVAGALTSTPAVTVTGNGTLIDGDATLANNNGKNDRINSLATLTLGGGAVETAWGGTFTLYRPLTGTISQSLASLTVAPGASTIQNLGTGGTATLIFTDPNNTVYTRNAGGSVSFATGTSASFTNAPSSNTSTGTVNSTGASGLDTILVGAFFANADFVKAAAGTVTAVTSYDTQNDASAWGTAAGHDGNINTSAAISGTTGTDIVTINSLKSATASSVITIGTAGTDSLNIKSGMILSTATLTINGPGTLTSGNGQDLLINNSATVTANAPISVVTLTKTGSGILSLASSASTISGDIYPRAGTLDFNFAGPASYSQLVSGVGAITKSGAGALTLSGPISLGGALTVNAGTANLTGLASLGGAVTVNNGGTLNWSNPYNYTGTTTGALTVGSTTGTGPAIASISSSGPLNTGTITVGGNSTGNGGSAAGHTLSISGGGTVDLKGSYLWVGGNSATGGGTGTLNVSGASTVIQSLTGNSHFDPGRGTNSIAYVNQSGGTINFQFSDWGLGGSVIAYQTGGTNVFRGLGESGGQLSTYTMTGGSVSGHLNLCGGPGGGSNSGDGANAIFTILGGTANATATSHLAGSTTTRTGMTATLNVGGGTATYGSGLNVSVAAVGNAVINLTGGTLATNSISAGTTGGASTINLAGGTIKYTANSSGDNWMRNFTNAYIFAGGAKIDTQSNNGTISQVLKSATGSGVTAVTVTAGEGYTAAPAVSFIGGDLAPGGSPAEAVATWDRAAGTVTGIVIVKPGQYTTPPTVVLSRQVGSLDTWTTAATAGIPAMASNAGGGLTKTGLGTLTLTGISTYTGDTTVSQGGLTLADNAGLNFVIGANGVNNKITGTGTLTLAGDFTFDLTGANTTGGNQWMIVDVGSLAEMFQSTFQVVDFTDAGGDTWTKPIATLKYYEFSEASGILKVIQTVVPGDANLDGVVDALDFITLKKNFGTTGATWGMGNFTTPDTAVNWADLNILTGSMAGTGGATSVAPEPCSAMLLVFGAMAVIRRRRS